MALPGVRRRLGLVAFWVLCAASDHCSRRRTRWPQIRSTRSLRRPREHWFGTDSLGRDSFVRVMAGGRALLVARPDGRGARDARSGRCSGSSAGTGAGSSTTSCRACFEAVLVLPVVIFASVTIAALGPVARRPPSWRSRSPMIPDRRANRARGGAVRTGSRIRRRRAGADRERARTSCSARSSRTSAPSSRAEFMLRLTQAVVAVATLSFIGLGTQPPTPDWGRQIAEHYSLLGSGRRRVGGPVPGAGDRLAGRRALADRRRA